MALALSLSGCGGLIKTAMTKSPGVCDDLMGQTVAQVQVKLGDPDGVKRNPDGTQVRTYRHGYFTGLISFDKDSKVNNTDCSKE